MLSCHRIRLPPFSALAAMYATTFAGEGLLMMYLFNNVRINGMDLSISALFSLVSYVPSLILTAVNAVFHSRLSLEIRLLLISLARALLCFGLVSSGAYAGVVATIIFIAVMEVLWYWLMPCFDELENASVHGIGAARGESILTVMMQVGLGVSLLLLLGGLQLLPPLLLLLVGRVRLRRADPAPEYVSAGEPVVGGSRALLALLVVLGVASAIPQMMNVVFPVKIFAVTDSSAVAGVVDAGYNLGSLMVAGAGLVAGGGLLLLLRFSTRLVSAAALSAAGVAITMFFLSSGIALLTTSYILLGYATTFCRVRVRAEIFSRLRGAVFSPWYARITTVTLLCQ